MDEAKLKRLIRMVEESDIDELEIDRPLGRVRITKRRVVEQPAPAPAAESLRAPVNATPAPASTAAEDPTAGREPGLVAVVAPMVGTFYSAPAPGAKPYVSEGERVAVGQVVCIVEAMKLMNEVQSEVAGTVRRVMAESGQAVEYGQELFLVAPG
ncbi:MAG: acetyl-CoA carboxylase biotin carboxyl carrier protein [bacterium]